MTAREIKVGRKGASKRGKVKLKPRAPKPAKPAAAQQSEKTAPAGRVVIENPDGEVSQLRARVAELEAAMSPDALAERLEPHLRALFVEGTRAQLTSPDAVLEHCVALEKLLAGAGLVPMSERITDTAAHARRLKADRDARIAKLGRRVDPYPILIKGKQVKVSNQNPRALFEVLSDPGPVIDRQRQVLLKPETGEPIRRARSMVVALA